MLPISIQCLPASHSACVNNKHLLPTFLCVEGYSPSRHDGSNEVACTDTGTKITWSKDEKPFLAVCSAEGGRDFGQLGILQCMGPNNPRSGSSKALRAASMCRVASILHVGTVSNTYDMCGNQRKSPLYIVDSHHDKTVRFPDTSVDFRIIYATSPIIGDIDSCLSGIRRVPCSP
jgi:hypothetical protein